MSFTDAQMVLQHQHAMGWPYGEGWKLTEDSEYIFDTKTNGLITKPVSGTSETETGSDNSSQEA